MYKYLEAALTIYSFLICLLLTCLIFTTACTKFGKEEKVVVKVLEDVEKAVKDTHTPKPIKPPLTK